MQSSTPKIASRDGIAMLFESSQLSSFHDNSMKIYVDGIFFALSSDFSFSNKNFFLIMTVVLQQSS